MTKMTLVDFAKSIRSNDIMSNFYELEGQLQEERVRVGGFGIIDGFKVTVNDYTLHIPAGKIVTREGDVQEVKGATLQVPFILPKEITYKDSVDSDTYIVGEDGTVTLAYAPYSLKNRGYLTGSYYRNTYPSSEEELLITINDTRNTRIQATNIDKNILTLDKRYAGKKVSVQYLRANNRTDIVTVTKDGQFKIVESVNSTSSSIAARDDYADQFVVCYVKTIVDDPDRLEVYATPPYQEVRPVYVDENNKLYLNGIPYEGTFIYFEEPAVPQLRTFWYDVENNKLYVWLSIEGIEQWVLVNARNESLVARLAFYKPEDNPEDLQTFNFEHREDMRFLPGNYEVQVNVNNSVLMQDEFTEIVEGDEDNGTGIGIKLNYALDEPSFVEIIVTHTVQTNPINTVFERVGSYVEDNSITYYEAAPDLDGTNFTTRKEYRMGENQLEVYLDGRRLVRNIDWYECREVGIAAGTSDKTQLSTYFKLRNKAEDGQTISYRVQQNVFSYSHLDKLLIEMKETVNEALVSANAAVEKANTIAKNANNKMSEMNDKMETLEATVKRFDSFLTADSILSIRNLEAAARKGLKSNTYLTLVDVKPLISIKDLVAGDFYILSQEMNGQSKVLKRGVDYEAEETKDSIQFALSQESILMGGVVQITGVHFGL